MRCMYIAPIELVWGCNDTDERTQVNLFIVYLQWPYISNRGGERTKYQGDFYPNGKYDVGIKM